MQGSGVFLVIDACVDPSVAVAVVDVGVRVAAGVVVALLLAVISVLK